MDESLFGDTKAEALRKAKARTPTVLPSSSSRPRLGASAARSGTAAAPAAVVVSSTDLEAMKARTAIKSLEDERAEKAAVEADKARRMEIANARKEKIRGLEEHRLAHVPKTALELEEEAERERRRAMAAHAVEEAQDDAKAMRAIQEYALTVSVRDRQLAERKALSAAAAGDEKMRDIETEIQRLEEMKRVHAIEVKRRAAAVAAAGDVRAQLSERIEAKQAALAALREEGAALVAEMKAADEEYKRKWESDRMAAKSLLGEVLAANEEHLALKAARKEAEVAEDRRLEALRLEMDAKKAAEEAERERQRKIREEAMFKVRGEVQKAQDTRAAVDELRAKRAFEAGQRAERARELERARKQKAAADVLRASRIEQLEAKQRRMAEEIEVDKAEFERAIEVQRTWLAAEREAQATRAAANREHVRSLLTQKQEKEAARAAATIKTREEGAKERAEADAKLARLQAMRDAKIAELLEMGVDPKYTVELARYDPAYAIKADYKLGATAAKRGDKKPTAP